LRLPTLHGSNGETGCTRHWKRLFGFRDVLLVVVAALDCGGGGGGHSLARAAIGWRGQSPPAEAVSLAAPTTTNDILQGG
jgi:hypothetical protein